MKHSESFKALVSGLHKKPVAAEIVGGQPLAPVSRDLSPPSNFFPCSH